VPSARENLQSGRDGTAAPLTTEDIPELIQQVVRGLNLRMGSTPSGTVLLLLSLYMNIDKIQIIYIQLVVLQPPPLLKELCIPLQFN